MHTTYFFIFSVGTLALIVGSFLNVVIYRLPLMLENEWRKESMEYLNLPVDISKHENQPFDLFLPRSHCLKCKNTISAFHNIPLISFLFLRGRCGSCKARIPLRYPIVELSCMLISVFLAVHFGASLHLIGALFLSWGLLCLSVIDFDHQLLPDSITLPLLWAGLAINLFGTFTNPHDAILGALFGYLSLWTVAKIFHKLTGKIGMGNGDFKLLAMLGAWLGWQMLPLIILFASLFGSITGISMVLLKGHDRNIPIPFGPFLAAAGWFALVYGHTLTKLYLSLAGF